MSSENGEKQYKMGDVATCRACRQKIIYNGRHWVHDTGEVQPRHIGQPVEDDRDRGLYKKYRVERVDGRSDPGQKHEHCYYFVLDVNHDPFAIPALEAYARACEDDYPQLAQDLENLIDKHFTIKEGWELPPAPFCPTHGKQARASVHHTGDGWIIGWDAPCCGPDPFIWNDGDDGVGELIEWPFNVNWARTKDWRKLGFMVV